MIKGGSNLYLYIGADITNENQPVVCEDRLVNVQKHFHECNKSEANWLKKIYPYIKYISHPMHSTCFFAIEE